MSLLGRPRPIHPRTHPLDRAGSSAASPEYPSAPLRIAQLCVSNVGDFGLRLCNRRCFPLPKFRRAGPVSGRAAQVGFAAAGCMSPQFRARLGLHTPNNSERTTPFNSESDSTAHGAGIQLTQYNVLYVTSIKTD